jgi:hypothetical protein
VPNAELFVGEYQPFPADGPFSLHSSSGVIRVPLGRDRRVYERLPDPGVGIGGLQDRSDQTVDRLLTCKRWDRLQYLR